MSLKTFPFRNYIIDYRDDGNACPCCIKKNGWKLEHSKLDAMRERMFVEQVNENTELKKKTREFFEWLESFEMWGVMSMKKGQREEYEEKKKALLK